MDQKLMENGQKYMSAGRDTVKRYANVIKLRRMGFK